MNGNGVADLRELCRLASHQLEGIREALHASRLACGEGALQLRVNEVAQVLAHVSNQRWRGLVRSQAAVLALVTASAQLLRQVPAILAWLQRPQPLAPRLFQL